MTNDSPPAVFAETPNLWIPIPNTSKWLPLTWEHTHAIRLLSRFFAGLYLRTQQSEDHRGLEKYRSWMITLCQMTATIYDELVRRNSSDEIARFLTSGDPGEESVEALEAANNLITPLMNFIRDAKERTRAEAETATTASPASPTVKEEEPSS